MSNQLSITGYSKHDLYTDLKKQIEETNATRACCIVAELACSKNEVAALVTFFTHEISENNLSHNLWFISHLTTKLKSLLDFPKRNISTNPVYQKLVCEIVVILCINKQKHFDFSSKVDFVNGLDHITSNAIDTLHFKEHMSFDLYQLMQALYYFIKKNEKKNAIAIVNQLVNHREAFNVSPFSNKSKIISNLKDPALKDIAWYIWKLIDFFIASRIKESRVHEYKTYANTMMSLFALWLHLDFCKL